MATTTDGPLRPAGDYLLEFSGRFIHLDLLPVSTSCFAVTVLAMSGTPRHSPSLGRLVDAAQAVTSGGMVIWFLGVLLAAVALRPLSALAFDLVASVGPLAKEHRLFVSDLESLLHQDLPDPQDVAISDPLVREDLLKSRIAYEREGRIAGFAFVTTIAFGILLSESGAWVLLSTAPLGWAVSSYVNAVNSMYADRRLRRRVAGDPTVDMTAHLDEVPHTPQPPEPGE